MKTRRTKNRHHGNRSAIETRQKPSLWKPKHYENEATKKNGRYDNQGAVEMRQKDITMETKALWKLGKNGRHGNRPVSIIFERSANEWSSQSEGHLACHVH